MQGYGQNNGDKRFINVFIGRYSGTYYFYVSDSGVPFDPAIFEKLGKSLDGDLAKVHEGALEDVLEFADIAGKVVLAEKGQRRSVDLRLILVQGYGFVMEQLFDVEGYVFLSRPEIGDGDSPGSGGSRDRRGISPS